MEGKASNNYDTPESFNSDTGFSIPNVKPVDSFVAHEKEIGKLVEMKKKYKAISKLAQEQEVGEEAGDAVESPLPDPRRIVRRKTFEPSDRQQDQQKELSKSSEDKSNINKSNSKNSPELGKIFKNKKQIEATPPLIPKQFNSVNDFYKQAMINAKKEMYDFEYNETDTFENEINELFLYTENFKFDFGRLIFQSMRKNEPNWIGMDPIDKMDFINVLLSDIECFPPNLLKPLRCLQYICQGVYQEAKNVKLKEGMQENCVLAYESGALEVLFSVIICLSKKCFEKESHRNSAIEKSALKVISENLKISLNIFYLIMCCAPEGSISKSLSLLRFQKRTIYDWMVELIITFGDGKNNLFPIKKMLLIFWKLILFGFGNAKIRAKRKHDLKEQANLLYNAKDKTIKTSEFEEYKQLMLNKYYGSQYTENEDPIDTLPKPMRESFTVLEAKCYTPLTEYQMDEEVSYPHQHLKEEEINGIRPVPLNFDKFSRQMDFGGASSYSKTTQYNDNNYFDINANAFGSPMGESDEATSIVDTVRQYLNNISAQTDFLDYYSIQRRFVNRKYWESERRSEVITTPIDKFYGDVFEVINPLLSTLMNILARAQEEENSLDSEVEIFKCWFEDISTNSKRIKDIEIARHKEILSKSITAIIIFLLKGFKSNHVLQFEKMSMGIYDNESHFHLYGILKNTKNYTSQISAIQQFEFFNMILKIPNKPAEGNILSWRNTFTIINILDILCITSKHKRHRVMEAVYFCKSPIILREILRIQCTALESACCSLNKLQFPYFYAVLSKSTNEKRNKNMISKTATWVFRNKTQKLRDTWAQSEIQLVSNQSAGNVASPVLSIALQSEKKTIKNHILSCKKTEDGKLRGIIDRFDHYHYNSSTNRINTVKENQITNCNTEKKAYNYYIENLFVI